MKGCPIIFAASAAATVNILILASIVASVSAFVIGGHFFTNDESVGITRKQQHHQHDSQQQLYAAPQRLEGNVAGPLYVNDRCINCAACAQFAPSVFSRAPETAGSHYHFVHHQPKTEEEIDDARAALAACPVAAIRTETNAQRSHRGDTKDRFTPAEEEMANQLASNPKFNGRPPPFPRRVSETIPDGVYFVGHHSEQTFGATPYLLQTKDYGWILVDTPKYSKSAVQAIEQLTGPSGPSYLFLTHVDDTTGHGRWKEQYPHLQRIFHAGDLGPHNWLGDTRLEDVEILLQERSSTEELQFFDLLGNPIENPTKSNINARGGFLPEVVLVHTPGHSPGSICLWKPPSDASGRSGGVIFTGDTYAYTTRDGGHMSGFPRYGNNRDQQAQILPLLAELDWSLVAPGHGHIRDYCNTSSISDDSSSSTTKEQRLDDMEPAIAELKQWSTIRR